MLIHRLRLHTDNVSALRDFYIGRLGFRLLTESENFISLACGQSVLEFVLGENCYYHFAFNIFPNQIASSAKWLEDRNIPLVPFEDERIVQFPNWDAEAVYFEDPSGNIGEFIARRRLAAGSDAQFSIGQVLNVCEIGFANFTHSQIADQIQAETGIAIFGKPSEVFTALGDDHGLFILVDSARKKWIPTMVPALPFPFEADVAVGGKSWTIRWDNATLSFQPA